MIDLIPGDVWQLRIFFKLGNQLGVNTVYYRVTANTASRVTDAEWAVAADVRMQASAKGVISSSATYESCQFQRVSPLPRTFAVFGNVNAGAGSRAADPMPKQVCGIVTWLTGFAGREFRGRVYTPFPAETDNDVDQTPTAAFLTQLSGYATAINSWGTTIVGAKEVNFEQVLAHKDPLLPHTPVVNFLVRDKWATQRRRGDYGRPNV